MVNISGSEILKELIDKFVEKERLEWNEYYDGNFIEFLKENWYYWIIPEIKEIFEVDL